MEHLWDIFLNDWHFVARLLVAMLLGGLVGVERQVRGRAAGLRTNILVCMGSAAIIVTFQKLSIEMNMGADSAFRMDPARTAAGVITGIGFLGAGTIVKSQDFVRGLTTAASIWVVSAIGVTVGLGEYVIAVPLTVLVLVALYAMHLLPIAGDQFFSLRLKWTGELGLLAEVEDRLGRERVHIVGRNVSRQPGTGQCQAALRLRIDGGRRGVALFDSLQGDPRFEEVGLG
ncbi:MgtC/SapB family protein [Pseudodesulfovibrio sp.]|uniref:MgtC/SapB family protein n=1 Tax=Pseudodesulfovibrio sp. TaxID=2035812 RepID=UPI002605100D|nr:MgtC/SapB family protein [Pseudodesulfovibrio sp.]MDD3312776.1 MgtC/SapB family protein [Pseudodesulfovibrio sp.]